jgi:hypothetical protein
MHGIGNLAPPMARRHVEEARRPVDQLVAVLVPEIHALALGDQARCILEIAVGGERHPVLFERVRDEFFQRLGDEIHDFLRVVSV